MAQVLGQNPRRFPHTCADMRRHLNLHKNFLLRARTDDANHINLGRSTTFQWDFAQVWKTQVWKTLTVQEFGVGAKSFIFLKQKKEDYTFNTLGCW